MGVYSRLEKARNIGLKKSMLVGYNLFLRKIDMSLKRTALLSRPTSLQLECTTKCNLRCMMCDSPIWDRRGMDMKFSDFKKIIDQFPFLVSVNLQGMGEPLLNKDLFKMITYCKSKKIMVLFTTNATLLDETMAKKIEVDLKQIEELASMGYNITMVCEAIGISQSKAYADKEIIEAIKRGKTAAKEKVLNDLFARSEADSSSASTIFLAKQLGVFNPKYTTSKPKTITEASERITKIYADVAESELSEEKGKYLIGFLESYIKSVEVGSLEERIAALEESNGK